MIDLHSALKYRIKHKIKKIRIRPRVKRNKSRRLSGAIRKGYKDRAFTKIYILNS